MKKLILPFVLGAMLVSCSRDNDDVVANSTAEGNTNVVSSEKPVLLTKVIDEDGVLEFKYNGDKLSSILHEGTLVINVEYNGDKIVKVENVVENLTTEYFYDSDDKLVSSTMKVDKGEAGVFNTKRTFSYESDNIVKVLVEGDAIFGMPEYNEKGKGTTIFTLSNGNIVKRVDIDEDGFEYITTHIYDDKNTPFANIRGIDLLGVGAGYLGVGELGNKNNILSSVKVLGDGKTETMNSVIEYNDKGFPIKVQTIHKDIDGVIIESISTLEYNN